MSREEQLIHVGWLLATDMKQTAVSQLEQIGCELLKETLERQFPRFRWRVDFVDRRRYPPKGALDPLQLLEFGVQEKINRHWDYVLVVVPNELQGRKRAHTIGVPSSALETAVLSTAYLEKNLPNRFSEQVVILSLHLLGHLWGIEHSDEGPMVPPETPKHLQMSDFPQWQRDIIVDRLEEVADQRLEEQTQRWNVVSFYWRAFWADAKSILIDIVGYAPWLLPFRMARLTAATAVSLLILLLTAEAWEMGVTFTFERLIPGTILAIFIATAFLFSGKNLGQISRDVGWREQLTRTRIVVAGTVLLGMISLWLVLLIFSYLVGWVLPHEVLGRWVQSDEISRLMLLRHAGFMAMLGVLAGALGGNLEEEESLKARLFFDEET